MKIEQLNELYQNADDTDKKVFAEMRSNLLLVDGSHYKRTQDSLTRALDNSPHSKDQKLRLVKNHCQVVTKEYINSITKMAPWVKPTPHNENEMQDRKAAQLADDIWTSAKHTQHLKEKIRKWASNFVEIGEVYAKITWNPNKGKFLGYKQEVDESGQPLFEDMFGNTTPMPVNELGVPNKPKAGKEATFEGDAEIETIPAFNLLRAPEADCIEESPYLCVRKMKSIKDLKKMLKNEPDKLKMVEENDEETFQVFDSNTNTFEQKKNQVMMREFYFRPSPEHPEGYFYITIQNAILWEGELPFGLFPIVSKGFDEIQGSCRSKSVLRPLRPAQAEINRTASHIAMTQLVHGSSKVFVQNGTKVSKNINLPGMRIYNYTGAAPITQDGKAGEQFFGYLKEQVSELYQLANLSEIMAEKPVGSDPVSALQASMRFKKKFTTYAEKFEEFLIDVCKLYLQTAQAYFDESRVIQVVGRREQVNIVEFKELKSFDYSISLEPVSEDIDTQLGKMQNIQTVLQYVGKDIPEEIRGKLIRALPFVNQEQFFDEMTLDEDNITNDLLALDRGEMPQINKYDANTKYIRRLIHRMKEADFRYLNPEVQQNYAAFLQQHEQAEAQKQKELQEAQAGFIPTGGGIVKVDAYETVTNSDGKPTQRRMMFPMEAIQWLKKRVESQGSSQQSLASINDQSLIDMARMLDQGQAPQQMPPQMPA